MESSTSLSVIPYSSLPRVFSFSPMDENIGNLSPSTEDSSFSIANKVGLSSLQLPCAYLSLSSSDTHVDLDNEEPISLHLS